MKTLRGITNFADWCILAACACFCRRRRAAPLPNPRRPAPQPHREAGGQAADDGLSTARRRRAEVPAIPDRMPIRRSLPSTRATAWWARARSSMAEAAPVRTRGECPTVLATASCGSCPPRTSANLVPGTARPSCSTGVGGITCRRCRCGRSCSCCWSGPRPIATRQAWLILVPLGLVLLVWRMPADVALPAGWHHGDAGILRRVGGPGLDHRLAVRTLAGDSVIASATFFLILARHDGDRPVVLLLPFREMPAVWCPP